MDIKRTLKRTLSMSRTKTTLIKFNIRNKVVLILNKRKLLAMAISTWNPQKTIIRKLRNPLMDKMVKSNNQ